MHALVARWSLVSMAVLAGAGCGLTGPSNNAVRIRGTVLAAPTGSAAGAQALSAGSSTGAQGLRVSVVGTPIAATTDAAGKFEMSDVPAGTVPLRFEGDGIDARHDLVARPGTLVRITMQVSGSTVTVLSRVDEDDDSDEDGDSDSEEDGDGDSDTEASPAPSPPPG